MTGLAARPSGSHKFRHLIVGMTIGCLVVVLLLQAGPAAAFPRPHNICHDDSMTYKFTNPQQNWTNTQKDYVRNAVADWLSVKDYDGGRVVNSITEVTSGSAQVEVFLDPSPNGDSDLLGSAECTGQDTIALNPNKLTDATKFEHVARHEFGHLMGLHHTGKLDSFNGTPETMQTCTSPFSTALSQDDHASITDKNGDLNPETLHANAGFEAGTSFWGKSSVKSSIRRLADPLMERPTSASGPMQVVTSIRRSTTQVRRIRMSMQG